MLAVLFLLHVARATATERMLAGAAFGALLVAVVGRVTVGDQKVHDSFGLFDQNVAAVGLAQHVVRADHVGDLAMRLKCAPKRFATTAALELQLVT